MYVSAVIGGVEVGEGCELGLDRGTYAANLLPLNASTYLASFVRR